MQTEALQWKESIALGQDGVLDLGPPPPPRPVEWLRGLRALRELIADPQQTEKAFEVFLSLDGNQEERGFQQFCSHPTGRRLLAQRPMLVDSLSDRARLQAMPKGSFGRAFVDHVERTGLDPSDLIELKCELQDRQAALGEAGVRLDPVREWFRDRTILMHDLWHVLTGYGTDELGESALLPFSFGQLGGRANAVLTLGVVARGGMECGPSFVRYLYQAWQRGRRAAWLVALPYEELLARPIADVRSQAAIAPPEVAHPGGILCGDFEAESR